MRAYHALLALILVSTPLRNSAQGVEHLAARLAQMPEYEADVKFEVLLPSAEDPVTYDAALQSQLPAQTDTLSPCDFLIRWEAMSNSGPREGFSAYFDGNYYRYRNQRLQEYHFESSPQAFIPSGPGSQLTTGVHSSDQFAPLLPQFLSLKMAEMAANPDAYVYTFHPDTIVAGRRSIVVDGTRRNAGYDAEYFTYVYDYDTAQPVLIDRTTSPGSISEQLVTATYTPPSSAPIQITEEAMIEQWPEVFEKYRQSTFRAESLVGNPLPDFSAQILGTDQRIHYNRGEGFQSPTVIVFLDPAVSSTTATIEAVRQAMEQLPMPIDALWAFNTNDTAEIEEVILPLGPSEKALPSSGALIRNCGITLFPTLVLVDSQGIVKDVITGFNNQLASLVIQKAILIN